MTAVNECANRLAARVRDVLRPLGVERGQRREPFAYFGSFGDDFFSDE